jgi:hypothetical protein
MQTDQHKIVTCRDAAEESLKWWPVLTTDELNSCLRKLYDRSGHDTPEDKMRLNKLLCEARRRAAGWLLGHLATMIVLGDDNGHQ